MLIWYYTIHNHVGFTTSREFVIIRSCLTNLRKILVWYHTKSSFKLLNMYEYHYFGQQCDNSAVILMKGSDLDLLQNFYVYYNLSVIQYSRLVTEHLSHRTHTLSLSLSFYVPLSPSLHYSGIGPRMVLYLFSVWEKLK